MGGGRVGWGEREGEGEKESETNHEPGVTNPIAYSASSYCDPEIHRCVHASATGSGRAHLRTFFSVSVKSLPGLELTHLSQQRSVILPTTA